jgi:hypothetical protein
VQYLILLYNSKEEEYLNDVPENKNKPKIKKMDQISLRKSDVSRSKYFIFGSFLF